MPKVSAQAERNFFCGCGKSYLSVAALFLHTKIKHRGVKQEGSYVIKKTKPFPQGSKGKHIRRRGQTSFKEVTMEEFKQSRTKKEEDHEQVKSLEPPDELADKDREDDHSQQQIIKKLNRIIGSFRLPRNYSVHTTNGDTTCQDMMSNFLGTLTQLQADKLNVIRCFASQLEMLVGRHFNQQHWSQACPGSLPSLANIFYHRHRALAGELSLPTHMFVQVSALLYGWMYQHKWSNYRVEKRPGLFE